MTADSDIAVERLVGRVVAGDQRALARALTIIEQPGAESDALISMLIAVGRACPVVGFTGAPGVGKSTLVSAYVASLRRAQRRVGIVAVDPSSPMTGGALLGDRLRMGVHVLDDGVFIRSVASRGRTGGLARATFGMTQAMLAAGCAMVVIETVGTGQAEIDIVDLADVVVVVTAPGLGDDVQALKAGILEIADVLVVNKADVAGAELAVQQLSRSIALRTDGSSPTVQLTQALRGDGVDRLRDEIDAQISAFRRRGDLDGTHRRLCRHLADRALESLGARLRRSPQALEELAFSVSRGDRSMSSAVDALCVALTTHQPEDTRA